jgi:protein SCO1/2
VPPFAYQDQHGQTVTPATLRGKPYVANFIFTQCRTICPLLSAKMVQLARKLDGVDVRFVSFSVDPEHDTPEVLLAYQQRWRAEETRWTLLSTDAKTLPQLAAALHITAQKNDGPDKTDPIMHSGVFLLVDSEGLVRSVYDSEHREDFEALQKDVRTLAHATAGKPSPKLSPEALYHELSCAACHERPELAPPLKGLSGSRRELNNGLLVTADAAYLKESLIAPDAKRVSGYPLRMPTYDGVVPDDELDGLVSWLLSLPAEGPAEEKAEVDDDPVCHMKVRVTPDALSAAHQGHVFHFCSAYCRDRFVAAPTAFVAPQAPPPPPAPSP